MEIIKILEPSRYQSSFIGKVFSSEHKGFLEVTGVYKKGTNTLFSVDCSVCSLDEELFPKNSLLISKNNLNQGKYPCKCSNGWKPTNYQYKVLCGRYAEEVKDTLLNIDSSNSVTVYTEDYGRWEIPAKYYIKGKRSVKETNDTRKINLRKEDEYHFKTFLSTGKFLEGTVFKRSDKLDTRGYSVYWEYYCPSCSNDEYVAEGICDGVFSGCGGTLKLGMKSCRCSKTYKWSQEQREYQINNVCKDEGLVFRRWSEDYQGAFSKFEWICSKGHTNTTDLSNFLHLNHRCSVCAENTWGFYKEKEDSEDTLYLLRLSKYCETFYKIGRTFKEKDRFAYFSKFYKVEILSTKKDTHKIIFETERYLKRLLDLIGMCLRPLLMVQNTNVSLLKYFPIQKS